MPNDNVQMEKLDFSVGLEDGGNQFGIEDTQVLANKDLATFLLSDPDKVQNADDEQEKAAALEKAKQLEAQKKNQQQQQNQDTEELDENGKPKKPAKPVTAEDKTEAGRKALEGALFSEASDEDESGTGKPGAETPVKPNKTGNEDDTYVTLGKDLLRLGVFSKNSDDETEETITIKTPEEFLDRWQLEKKKGAVGILDNFLSQFGEDYRKMFDAVFVNGVKPQEYLNSFAKIETMKSLDMAQEGNQERVMRTYYKSLKWDDARIDQKIQKLKDYGDLEDEAKSYHEVLLSKETEAATQAEQKKVQEAQVEKERDLTIAKSYQRIMAEKLKAQEIDGIPLTQKDAEEVLAYLTNKPYKLASGEKLSEFDKDILELNRPENHEMKIKLGLLLRKKLDLSSVKKTAVSKKSDALFTLSTKNAKQKDSKEKEIKSFF